MARNALAKKEGEYLDAYCQPVAADRLSTTDVEAAASPTVAAQPAKAVLPDIEAKAIPSLGQAWTFFFFLTERRASVCLSSNMSGLFVGASLTRYFFLGLVGLLFGQSVPVANYFNFAILERARNIGQTTVFHVILA